MHYDWILAKENDNRAVKPALGVKKQQAMQFAARCGSLLSRKYICFDIPLCWL